MSKSTVYRGAQVLVGDPRRRDVRRVDVEVRDGLIARLGPDLEAPDAESVDVSWGWIMPGLVDTHHHLWQSTMRAFTSDFTLDDYFWTIRRNHSARHRAEDVHNGTLGGAVGLLEAGTTCTVDFSHCVLTPEHADAGVAGFRAAGIRGVWCYGFYHQPMDDPWFKKPEERHADARRVRATHFAGDDGRVRFGISPTEMVRVPFEQIATEIRVGRELDALIHPHTNTRFRPGYPSDIRQWHDAGLIWAKQLHSHCNTADADDLRILADAGAAVSSTPETELGMGLGQLIVRAADRAGVTTGLGADIQSNNSPDLFTAMRIAIAAERGRYHQPVIEAEGTSALGEVALRTEDVLHFATLGGARGLGLGDVCGSIEVGKAADLLFIRTDTPRLRAVTDVVNAIVMHVGAGDVDTVLVGGEVVKQGGRLREDLRSAAVRALDESGAWLDAAIREGGGWRPDKPEWMGTPAEHRLSNAGT
ncbi:amidohydrolase family protein [Phytohabitans sp. ZYX-F-186]|uniref:Amidohydrolase family protein n=1 Tax=Phytohabitans maris TaxID=3071409 RepID=A0ABU0ZIH3_9ACTN|nr:amidohydrolase family protein [Phytohabitans sp. ZYX-F-186]MDQ7905752.1 amidohydrolase family protein [Phytohabitans sp. ZYX-F-186]